MPLMHNGKRVANYKHPLYPTWLEMRQRCRYPGRESFRDYGGRGIRVCARWDSFAAFVDDMGLRPDPKSQLERIDNDGNYEPGNCRWATKTEQMRNTRRSRRVTHLGRTMTMAEWGIETGLGADRIRQRLNAGWPVHIALTAPPQQGVRPR